MVTYVSHKKARLHYRIIEQLEAGIELSGHEVKSLRDHRGSLDGAHVRVLGGEAYLVNAFIPPYQAGNTPSHYDPNRPRRLLLKKEEIASLGNIERGKGLTIVPISVYNVKSKIKVAIVIARGKKTYDKRETLKKRAVERDLKRTLKNR